MEYVLGCRTAHEAWTNLVDIYASVLKSRVNHLKKELHTIQKGTDSIDKYLLRLKAIREQLTVAGEYVSDIMIGGLAGLPKEYAVIRTVVQARESSITMKEFRAQLIGAEKEIEGEMNVLSQNMSAMFVQGSTSNSNAASSSNPQIKCPMSGKVIAEVAFIGNNVILYFTMFEEIRLLGFGAFATVALCRHKVDGSDYAVKKIPIGRYVSFDYERVRSHLSMVSFLVKDPLNLHLQTDISEEDINHDQCPCLCIVQRSAMGLLVIILLAVG